MFWKSILLFALSGLMVCVYGQPTPELLFPQGHIKQVLCTAYSKDGKYIATGSEDNNVIIWDAITGKKIHFLNGHINRVICADFSSDGKWLATGSEDNTTIIWDVKKGTMLYTLSGHINKVSTVKFSPDANYLLTASNSASLFSSGKDKTARLWDLKTMKEIHVFKELAPISLIDFSPDSKYCYTQTTENLLKIRKLPIGNSIDSFVVKETNPFAALGGIQEKRMKFLNDQKTVVVCLEKKVVLYDLLLKKIIKSIPINSDNINELEISSDNKTMMIANMMGIVHYDLVSGKIIKEQILIDTVTKNTLFSFNYKTIFSLKNNYVITANTDSSINTWDIRTGELIHKIKAGSILSFELSPGEFFCAITELGKAVKIYDLPYQNLVTELKGHINNVRLASFLPNKNKVITLADNTIKIWDIPSARMVNIVETKNEKISEASLSPAYNYLYFNTGDIGVYESESGKLLKKFGGKTTYDTITKKLNYKLTSQISNDDKLIAISSTNDTIEVFDLQKLRLVNKLSNGSTANSLMFSHDSKYLLTHDNFKSKLYIWDLEKNIIADSISKLNTVFSSGFIAMSKTKNIISYSTLDGTIMIYDIDKRLIVKQLANPAKTQYNKGVLDIENNQLLTGGDFITTLWDIRTGKKIWEVMQKDYSVHSIQFGYNNDVIVVGSDGKLHLYDIKTGKELGSLFLSNGIIPQPEQLNNNLLLWKDVSSFYLQNLNNNKLQQWVPLEKKDYLISSGSRYFLSTPNAGRWINWQKDEVLYDFDQWDLQYNRPYKILEELPGSDSLLIEYYKEAFNKRVRKEKADTSKFNESPNVPDIEIINAATLEGLIRDTIIKLTIRAFDTDKNSFLKEISVLVNGVPLYGAGGMNIAEKPTRDTTLTISIALNRGKNLIKVSCSNDRSATSAKKTVYINSMPLNKPVQPKLWYIGIGVSNYQNPQNNLTYAAKDVNDIAAAFKEADPAANIILFQNENATRENILAVKTRLLKESSVEDKVIISLSGHGITDRKTYEFYFGTHDIDFKQPGLKGLSYEDIDWLVDGIPARQRLVLIDACHSGEVDKEEYSKIAQFNNNNSDSSFIVTKRSSFTEEDDLTDNKVSKVDIFRLMKNMFNNIAGKNGTTIISAAAGTEFAYEGQNWKNGVFTYSLLNGLLNRLADLNDDGEITVTELQDYVGIKVQELTNGLQNPTSRQVNLDNDWVVWKK